MERFLLLICSLVCFQRLLLLSVLELFVSAPFDQCDQVEEELEGAPNLSRRTPLSREVIECFLKVGVPYRLAMLDFAEAAIPAKTTRDSAFVEAGIVAGRLLLQFLGLGVRRKGGLMLIANREYHTENGFTDEVKITDLGGRFVEVASLDAATADALAHYHNGASKASAHFTWDSGHQLKPHNVRRCIPIIRNLVLTHLPSYANGA